MPSRRAPSVPSGYEGLGVFYLGRALDADGGALAQPVLYDARDLVTHAVCIGMTGSGKTGLGVCLLEEAALDGVPAIVIDPKGDLTNLLLTFPELRPDDFLPWVNADDARQRGLSVDAYAQEQAALWARGLAEWGQDGTRIRRLREAADFAIYTPGSTAGLPVSLLRSFAAPPAAVRADREALAERVGVTATGLLGLVGLAADPLQSREHILVATILEAAWRDGVDLDLPALIHQIQAPPVARVGVLDLETFFPSPERFQLAVRLNNLLAAPGFAAWTEGEPLDVDRLLHTPAGGPRVSVIYLAHLSDAERMFFVALLLAQVVGWMRGQSGTTTLRALLYMDEVFGFFPPVANPPSKGPLLALLKQARAFGLGVVLATQNPVDLDYKGLANAGTWFLGRLQTERDKARVLDGLEGVAASAGGAFERARIDATLSGLGKRVFLLHNVHEAAPLLFETRWAMSYLRGPLTRDQVRRLMEPHLAGGAPSASALPRTAEARGASAAVRADAPPVGVGGERLAGPGRAVEVPVGSRPVLPPEIRQVFLPARLPSTGPVHYEPHLLASARVHFEDARFGVDVVRDISVLVPMRAGVVTLAWDAARDTEVGVAEVEADPAPGATFEPPPPAASRPKSYEGWTKDFARWILQARRIERWRHPGTGLVSEDGEAERTFRIRLQDAWRERRDAAVERLREKHGARLAALQERLRRAEQALAREQLQAQQQQVQTAVSMGATLLGALVGRRAASAGTLGRATTAARGATRAYKEAQDVRRAQETVELVRRQLAEVEAQVAAEVRRVGASGDPATDPLERVPIAPRRGGVVVQLVALGWVPATP
ncbi:MAG: DUF87 domain-containing protein [Armatimonadota bacterium]|nr:DUF87 domain-containing protein [Armatimonadota bacterium]